MGTKKNQTEEKNTVQEECGADTVSDEVMKSGDSFWRTNKKLLLFVLVGMGISFPLIAVPSLLHQIPVGTAFIGFYLYILVTIYIYCLWIANFVHVERPFLCLKSIFHTLRSWVVWTGGFVLTVIFWSSIYTFLERLLRSFYDAFPWFCEEMYVILEEQEELHYVVLLFLILFPFLLSLYFGIKSDKYKFSKENFLSVIFRFIKIVLFYILFSIICFAIFLPIQYTIKKTTGITFCSALVSSCFDNQCVAKPIIYLYPTETTDVSVKLGAMEKLTHTYPKYVDEWKVRAEPNGDLTDMVTGRKYYALYWEGKDADLPRYDDGFVVAKDEVVPFLEEKLAKLGLNEREANEFIIYWLPKLESAPYTFIHFVSQDEQDKNMPLTVQPKPETIIRVLMAFKSLDKPIEVKEQVLPEMPKRDGFTVIEWGGTEIPVL